MYQIKSPYSEVAIQNRIQIPSVNNCNLISTYSNFELFTSSFNPNSTRVFKKRSNKQVEFFWDRDQTKMKDFATIPTLGMGVLFLTLILFMIIYWQGVRLLMLSPPPTTQPSFYKQYGLDSLCLSVFRIRYSDIIHRYTDYRSLCCYVSQFAKVP